MEMTIIGVYDQQEHARAAKNELLASGFARGGVQLNPDHELSATRGPSVQSEQHATLSASIGNFFRSLFGIDDKSTYSNVYAEAVRRGAYVLTVDVGSDELRMRAEEIMGHHGPVDIEERSAAWIRQGWRGHDPAVAPEAAGKLRTVQRRKEEGGQD
jgi:hypothetical protein